MSALILGRVSGRLVGWGDAPVLVSGLLVHEKGLPSHLGRIDRRRICLQLIDITRMIRKSALPRQAGAISVMGRPRLILLPVLCLCLRVSMLRSGTLSHLVA